jgi:predicted sulfurtransferase
MSMPPPYTTLRRSLIEAIAITIGISVAALLIHPLHPNRIPLIAASAYETMVPCPVQEGHVTAVDATDEGLNRPGSLFVDARDEIEYKDWHMPGAVMLTYDFLDPIPEAALTQMARQIAAEGVSQVIVYGDGGDPDTGKLLGIDISASGIKHVKHVRGGASALKAANRSPRKGVSQ